MQHNYINKETAAKIKQGLEHCKSVSEMEGCDNCPYDEQSMGKVCIVELIADALELISCQQAEIERLNGCVKTEDEVRTIAKKVIDSGVKLIKAEAIKEFAERLHAMCGQDRYVIQISTKFDVIDKQYLRVVDGNDIDEVYAEMVGDAE